MPNSSERRDNIDRAVVEGFGDEWSRFDQSALSDSEHRQLFQSYFAIFPWEALSANATGMDIGCGSGRWAKLIAPRVGTLHCVDASSEALAVARRSLAAFNNVHFHHGTVGSLPFGEDSLDFGYSLGVLHHVPDTQQGMSECVRALKPGAPFLVYLYYAFDNRPAWFRGLWQVTDILRRGVSGLPYGLRYLVSQVIAATIYWPLARTAGLIRKLGPRVDAFPLSAYADKSFYTMRTDALDRFGTRLEQRFTRDEIARMMELAGLDDVRFHDDIPFWCAVGRKRLGGRT
jgi:ubiquinone/menaquinone biosynthesis C-methylase UbiE